MDMGQPEWPPWGYMAEKLIQSIKSFRERIAKWWVLESF
jgi:hypothetical protein